MKALIIGGAGFVGRHLTDHLQNDCKWSVSVTKLKHEHFDDKNIEILNLDILEKKDIAIILEHTEPDYIFHLAAQSSVALSWKNPQLTSDINVKGTLNVLDAIKESGMTARLILVGSGEEYGLINMEEIPIKECTMLRPGNIYAATKACQNMFGNIYVQAYDMDIIMARPFNHIGPGQAPLFVISNFCKQVVDIEKGIQEPVIYVGNLSSKRDFTDVRDIVCAYSELMKKGRTGETYNIGSGHAVELQEVLNLILSCSKSEIIVKIDPSRFRPVDVPMIEADISKLKKDTGWHPNIALKQTISDTLDYWRKKR